MKYQTFFPKSLIKAQRSEITECNIYSCLAEKAKTEANRKILLHMAKDELKHYRQLKERTKKDLQPYLWKIYFYRFLSATLGLSFSLKFMENNERKAIASYGRSFYGSSFVKDELRHEKEILRLIKEERIEYAGSIVLGLNDALVELTGALTGLTFALRSSKIVALSGFITGFAAALSMAASAFLSFREDVKHHRNKKPLRGAIYTGVTYITTVLFLILPFLLLKSVFLALGIMIGIALLIIASYTFFITTAKNLRFWPRFLEMSGISLLVSLISFCLGTLLRIYFGAGM
ncbi:MAG: VIT1/CCC1 family protein [Nanoarchaeota archaeon]